MVNNTNKLIFLIAGSLLTAILIASCANLPVRVTPAAPAEPVSPENNSVVSQNPTAEDDGMTLTRPENIPWVEPAAGMTVTPIVLPIEKRGEEGGLIIRTESDNSEGGVIYYENGEEAPLIQAVYPTATPAAPDVPAVYGGLKDEMSVYSFAPVSGAVVLPNQALHMDVMLKNTGTTTWQTTYKVTDISANPITVIREYNLPYAVAPQGTVMLSIYMTAPAELGTYQETFSIQDAYGAVFGSFDYSLVVGGFSSITEIPTLTATITPTYYSAAGITATPDELRWMCIDPERSKLQDCYQFCVEYSDREEFSYCFYDGIRYTTPIP